jgi:hypothetical protein
MATPADQRLLELVGKWLTSLDLHAKYCSLDDDSYFKVQPWPKHQRPSRWIIDLARQKTAALRFQIQERIGMGDATFSESLELMAFLANLVGSEHIERFIPLAEPALDRAADLESTGQAPALGNAASGTREMPKFDGAQHRAPPPTGSAAMARSERRAPEARPAAKSAARTPAASGATVYTSAGPSEEVRDLVIADAARLVQWGRKWYELAELIASMADRPHVTDVRRILKDNKQIIDAKAGRS